MKQKHLIAFIVFVILLAGRVPTSTAQISGWGSEASQTLPVKTTQPVDITTTASVDVLLTLLTSNDPALRAAAALELGKRGDTKAITPLLQVSYDTYANVRSAAVTAIGQLGLYDSLYRLQFSLWQEIARQVLPRLTDVLLNDSDAGVRIAATRALFYIRDSECILALSQALDLNNAYPDVRSAIIGELASWAVAYRQAVLQSQVAVKLMKIASDANETLVIRLDAILALGVIGDRQAIAVLSQILSDRNPSSNALCREAARALGNIGDNQATEILRRAAYDSDRLVRIEAALSLAEMGDNYGASVLLEALALGDQGTGDAYYLEAARALGQLGESRALELLFSLYVRERTEDRTSRILSAIAGAGRNDAASKAIVAQRLNLTGARLEAWNRFGILILGKEINFSESQVLQINRVLAEFPSKFLRAINLIFASAMSAANLETKTVLYYPIGRSDAFPDSPPALYAFTVPLMHEIGHLVYGSLGRDEQMAFERLYWDSLSDGRNFISNYARRSDDEDFAEIFKQAGMDSAGLIFGITYQPASQILREKVHFVLRLFAYDGRPRPPRIRHGAEASP